MLKTSVKTKIKTNKKTPKEKPKPEKVKKVEKVKREVKKEIKTTLMKDSRRWPTSEKELKDYILASAVVFIGLILILTFITAFSFNSLKLVEGLQLRALIKNQGEIIVKRERQLEKMNEYVYYPDAKLSVDERFRALNLDKDISINEELFMLINSEPKDLLSLKFLNSPDGKSFATIIQKDEQEAVVLNGVVGDFYDSITSMTFSPNSKRFAYVVKKDGKELVVLDGQEGKMYDWVFSPRLFSPDSKYFIYKTRNSQGDLYVFNSTEGEAYDQLYEPFFNEADNSMIFFSRRGNSIYKSALKL